MRSNYQVESLQFARKVRSLVSAKFGFRIWLWLCRPEKYSGYYSSHSPVSFVIALNSLPSPHPMGRGLG